MKNYDKVYIIDWCTYCNFAIYSDSNYIEDNTGIYCDECIREEKYYWPSYEK